MHTKQSVLLINLVKRVDNLEILRILNSAKSSCAAEVPFVLEITLRNTSIMITSSNGNIFRVTGPLCGEFTSPGEFSTQRPVKRRCFLWSSPELTIWVNNREAGDLRRHRGHYDVNVMMSVSCKFDSTISFITMVAGIILCMCPANERHCYNVVTSLIGWAHTQNDPTVC